MGNPSQSYGVVKFHIIIGHLCLLCHPHGALPAMSVASTSRTSLDTWINAWGSVSDLHACSRFRCSKKVEKHWLRHLYLATENRLNV